MYKKKNDLYSSSHTRKKKSPHTHYPSPLVAFRINTPSFTARLGGVEMSGSGASGWN